MYFVAVSYSKLKGTITSQFLVRPHEGASQLVVDKAFPLLYSFPFSNTAVTLGFRQRCLVLINGGNWYDSSRFRFAFVCLFEYLITSGGGKREFLVTRRSSAFLGNESDMKLCKTSVS